jgi:hypothetical protein
MTWRNLLLYGYPRSWREEYGEELAGILAQTRLTPRLVGNVVTNGVRQHLRRDDPWKLCGAGLALWILMARPLLAAFGAHGPVFVLKSFAFWYAVAGFLIVSVAGAMTVVRCKSGVWRATAASLKATLMGQGAVTIIYVPILRAWGTTQYLGHNYYFWFGKTLVCNIAISIVFGLAGAAFGHRWTQMHTDKRIA